MDKVPWVQYLQQLFALYLFVIELCGGGVFFTMCCSPLKNRLGVQNNILMVSYQGSPQDKNVAKYLWIRKEQHFLLALR